MTNDVSMIFFKSSDFRIGIDDASESLKGRGLQVVRSANSLSVQWDDGPALVVSMPAGPHVTEEAVAIGKETSFASAMSQCDTRFEIGIEDLDETLDEINTLIEVQSALQEATNGYLFNSWNDQLSGPAA